LSQGRPNSICLITEENAAIDGPFAPLVSLRRIGPRNFSSTSVFWHWYCSKGAMLVKHMAGSAGFLDLAIVPIKTVLGNSTQSAPQNGGVRKIALMEESGGVLVEKLLFSGEASAAELKVVEMIQVGRKMVLSGFHLEEIAAWCFTHNYRWRFHHGSREENSFIIEPEKDLISDAKEAGAKP
jgi:hypothetical protein